MSSLLEELQNEHRIMLDILDQVRHLGISSKTGQDKFLSIRDLLISHMRKEDERYYPALRRAAENNEALKLTLDYFARDMAVVSRRAMQVFDKYAQGGTEKDFAGDLTLLYMTLKDRIRIEEETLFKKYSHANEEK
jgi:iron-sulfur cluster repair protein YtfE (RIC family)